MIKNLLALRAKKELLAFVLEQAVQISGAVLEKLAPLDIVVNQQSLFALALPKVENLHLHVSPMLQQNRITLANAQVLVSHLSRDVIDTHDEWLECTRFYVAFVQHTKHEPKQEELNHVLEEAIETDDDASLQYLLNKCNVSNLNSKFLFTCISMKRYKLLQLFLQYVPVNVQNQYEQTPLMVAADAKDSTAVELLLETNKCEMQLQDSFGHSALWYLQQDWNMQRIYNKFQTMAALQQSVFELKQMVKKLAKQ